jgi:hypothetical protein
VCKEDYSESKHVGTCPVCEKFRFDVSPRKEGLGFYVGCWSCNAAGLTGGDYLHELLAAIGAQPNEGGNLLALGPEFPELAPWLEDRPRDGRAPEPLPTVGAVAGRAAGLLSQGRAAAGFAYLSERRGLSTETVARYYVGFSLSTGDLTFPAFSGDAYERDWRGYDALDLNQVEIVGEVRRKPVDGAKVRALRGHPRMPYPNLPARGGLLLVAGEIDALTGRQLGLPAVTVSGASLPERAEPAFHGRTVAVMFDAGDEEAAAEKVVRRLRDGGGTAWRVPLSKLGLPSGFDLNDYHRNSGSLCDLRALIRNERRSSR